MDVALRLDQGPFGIEQDEGWCTIASTTPSDRHIRNFGLGMVGYAWEENGPSIAARKGEESLESHIEKLSSLPFVDVLYIRCDWRDVQNRPGKLDLHPVWGLAFDAARRHGLRVAFRIQMSSPEIQPGCLSVPEFLSGRIPFVKIGKGVSKSGGNFDLLEPGYDHPEFMKAFRELNELLASEFDGHRDMEFVDLMMYGFWGEGHTSSWPNPFPDYYTAQKTFAEMTQLQIDTWKRTPLAVNTQPDISRTGNRLIRESAIEKGCWLRSDSILVEEPMQVDILANRPPWLPVIMEDGYKRHYRCEKEYLEEDENGINLIDKAMLHTLDLGANYWSLWTEADNLKLYYEKYPDAINRVRSRMGYRLRPSWVWQRKRYGTDELVVCVVNDGISGVPGTLSLQLECLEAGFRASGCLDRGRPYAGGTRQAAFILPRGMAGKKFKLKAELQTAGGMLYPVEWACRERLDGDGSFMVQLKSHDDINWRKGV